MHKRPIFNELCKRLEEPRKFIQALLGPRQVGKTTLALQAQEILNLPSHYVTADTATLQDLAWIEGEWEAARQLALKHKEALLIIDEAQKIPQWASLIKKLWDEDTQTKTPLKVILLGSSPWLMQKGLSESLAGRFEILPITHWSYTEVHTQFRWDVEKFLYFGGYPGAAPLADPNDPARWLNYINDSLIETTISRDILLMTQVNKPALLRRLFQLGCNYSGQILSYQKMLGQLQDAGNTTTLAHYLELLTGAGMIAGIQKFSLKQNRSKSSSPKLQVFNTALMAAQSGKSFHEAQNDSVFWGRLTESSVGAHLINGIRGTQIQLFYWREGQQEVDYVLQLGDKLLALEVKSNHRFEHLSGMSAFKKSHPQASTLLVGSSGLSLKEFFEIPINSLL